MTTPQPLSKPRIIIQGLGLVSPLGLSAWATFSALLAGRSITDRLTELPQDTAPADLVRAVGSSCIAQHSSLDPAIELAERAAREAAVQANISLTNLPTFIATSKGAVHALQRATEQHYQNQLTPTDTKPASSTRENTASSNHQLDPYAHPAAAIALGPTHYLTYHLARRLHINPVTHTVAACASSLTALHQAAQHLQNPASPNVSLILAAEAALIPQLIYSYKRLGVLAKTNTAAYHQTPLDQHRTGFMLAEFGAAIILKRLAPGQSPQPGQLELTNTGITASAYDLMRTHPQMPELTHLAQSLFQNQAIDVLHPHATGTPDHDPAELSALSLALQTTQQLIDPIETYAVKGVLGHGLGAAGLVSLITAALSLTAGKLPPMPWIKNPMPLPTNSPIKIDPSPHSISRTGTHAVFAAGFGGHTAAATLKRH
ncbi:beta-ketoacyl synthase N-terminal-like domain-containing protein [Poriferisphaera sp. WC338]|uniref:beta-ketoacyl synthase N-terminal-like domain-containing protein n=1 Tax=Poriferisphaera sp. WC338 TaxID=3425129 RepID=UPI003D8136DB